MSENPVLRMQRIRESLERGEPISDDDREWVKAVGEQVARWAQALAPIFVEFGRRVSVAIQESIFALVDAEKSEQER